MAVIYVGTCPYDPELELKNFEQKQAEYEAAWRSTLEPLVLREALLHAQAAQQLTPDWLVTALGDAVMWGRTDQTAERLKDRMLHVRRYRCVRDLRRKGHIKDNALDLAVTALQDTDAAGVRSTIEGSYNRVSRDLKRAGCDSVYFHLVVRSDPTVIPVHPEVIRQAQRSGGVCCEPDNSGE